MPESTEDAADEKVIGQDHYEVDQLTQLLLVKWYQHNRAREKLFCSHAGVVVRPLLPHLRVEDGSLRSPAIVQRTLHYDDDQHRSSACSLHNSST